MIAQITSLLGGLKWQNKTSVNYYRYTEKGQRTIRKKWISCKGNIFLSIYFTAKENISQKSMTKKSIRLLKSLNSFVNEKITIKTPNDLLIKGNKVCGIHKKQ